MSRKNIKPNYSLYKYLTVVMGSLLVPLGTFIGFEFGAKNYTLALIGLIVQIIYVFIQGIIWWSTMEKLGAKQI